MTTLVPILVAFAAYFGPALLHALFVGVVGVDPASKLGGVVARIRKLGFDPTAFEPEAQRLLKVALVKASKDAQP